MKCLVPLALLAAGGCGDSASRREAAREPTERTFTSAKFKVAMTVPARWRNEPLLGAADEAVGAPDGYVKLTALAGARSLGEACEVEAEHRRSPYGPRAKVDIVIKVAGQAACRITPTVANAQAQRIPAGLIVMYPVPLEIEPEHIHRLPYPWLVVWTDPKHLNMVERSLRFLG